MVIKLIVAAPGTHLTSVAASLETVGSSVAFDVEERLKAMLSEEDRRQARRRMGADQGPLRMVAICRAFPREKVLALWEQALLSCIAECDPAQRNLIVGHLTLYRDDRSEHYSTSGILLKSLVSASAEVSDVVLLIDDVYDMYEQLVGARGALNGSERVGRWADFTSKTNPSGALTSEMLAPQLDLETSIQTVNLLVSWRRQESLAAESIASALNARLTVLGIKHEFDAARIIADDDSARTAYISHPISAYRREINKKVEDGDTSPAWDAAVVECNALPGILAASGSVVAIMPTAIDEMRFRPVSNASTSVLERSPELGPRWPLINGGADLVGGTFTDEDVQHSNLFVRGKEALVGSETMAELTRFLEGLFFIEIPYRDHLLVANCDDLLVYRPLADHGRLSSGVKHEIRHWWDRVANGDRRTRYVAVHSFEDLMVLKTVWEGTATWADFDGEASAKRTVRAVGGLTVEELQKSYGLTLADAMLILDGRPLHAEQLGGHMELSTAEAAQAVRHTAIGRAVDTFIRRELSASEQDGPQARVVIIDQRVALSPRRARYISEFLMAETLPGERMTLQIIGDEDAQPEEELFIATSFVLEHILGVAATGALTQGGDADTQTDRVQLAINAAVRWITELANAHEQVIRPAIES